MNITRNQILLQFLPYFIFCFIGILFLLGCSVDDRYITLWAAKMLAEKGEILNYNFQRFEQSSSLFHTLLLALIYKITETNIVTIGWFFSFFTGLLSIYQTGELVDFIQSKNPNKIQIKVHTQILLSLIPSFLYWSYAGLETLLYTFLWLTLILSYLKNKNFLMLFFLLLLLIATRPEAIFVIVCLFFGIIGIKFLFLKEDYKKDICIILLAILAFAVITWVRWTYFGTYFPAPVSAKIGFNSNFTYKFYEGIMYVFKFLRLEFISFCMAITLILNYLFVLFKKPNQLTLANTLIFLFVVTIFANVVLSGGDWMEYLRFFVVIIPFLCCFFISYIYNKQLKIIYFIYLFSLLNLLYFIKNTTSLTLFDFNEIVKQQPEFAEKYSFNELLSKEHLSDMKIIDTLNQTLLHDSRKTISLMTGQGGMVPFYVIPTIQKEQKKIKFIDIAGLVTDDFSKCNFLKDKLNPNQVGIGLRFGHLFPTDSITKRVKQKMNESSFYRYYLFKKNEIFNSCKIELPDYIYEIRPEFIEYSKNSGYKEVYRVDKNKPLIENSLLQSNVYSRGFVIKMPN